MRECFRFVLFVGAAASVLGSWSLASAEETSGRLRVVRWPGGEAILLGDRALAVCPLTPSSKKAYVKRLVSPGGTNVLRDAPSDHLHHHGLMFGVTADGVDFWDERPKTRPGSQVHQSLEDVGVVSRDGRQWAGFTQRLDWLESGKAERKDGKTGEQSDPPPAKLILKERRRIELTPAAALGEPTLLTWRTELRAASDKTSVVLTGRHFVGLGIRFVDSMDKNGRVLTAGGKAGRTVRGRERISPVAWAAYVASAEGKPVTVALFDHPANPRHPAGMFTMTEPFAYLTATLDVERNPLTLAPGKKLDLCYGVAIYDGEVDSETIERQFRAWAKTASAADKAS